MKSPKSSRCVTAAYDAMLPELSSGDVRSCPIAHAPPALQPVNNLLHFVHRASRAEGPALFNEIELASAPNANIRQIHLMVTISRWTTFSTCQALPKQLLLKQAYR